MKRIFYALMPWFFDENPFAFAIRLVVFFFGFLFPMIFIVVALWLHLFIWLGLIEASAVCL